MLAPPPPALGVRDVFALEVLGRPILAHETHDEFFPKATEVVWRKRLPECVFDRCAVFAKREVVVACFAVPLYPSDHPK